MGVGPRFRPLFAFRLYVTCGPGLAHVFARLSLARQSSGSALLRQPLLPSFCRSSGRSQELGIGLGGFPP